MTTIHTIMAWINKVGEESFNAFYINSNSEESDLVSTSNFESKGAAEFWIQSRAESLDLPIEWISSPS